MRNELLKGEHFDSVLEARVLIGRWVHEYNVVRPHRGLGYKIPAAFYETQREGTR